MSGAHPQFCVCDKCSSRIAMEHLEADARCGRDWDKDGCNCGACRLTRKNLDEIEAGFARIEALEAKWRAVRAVKSIEADPNTQQGGGR